MFGSGGCLKVENTVSIFTKTSSLCFVYACITADFGRRVGVVIIDLATDSEAQRFYF